MKPASHSLRIIHRAAGAAVTRRRKAEKARQKFVARREDKGRTQSLAQSGGSTPSGNDGEDLRQAARLQKEDIKTTIEIVHNTNQALKEADTGEPSRLVKDLFLEPSGALNEGALRGSYSSQRGALYSTRFAQNSKA